MLHEKVIVDYQFNGEHNQCKRGAKSNYKINIAK